MSVIIPFPTERERALQDQVDELAGRLAVALFNNLILGARLEQVVVERDRARRLADQAPVLRPVHQAPATVTEINQLLAERGYIVVDGPA